MALSKKGSRLIVVEGVSFRWVVAPNDEPGMATVDKALATSRGWKILLTMDKEGDYPEVVWDYAHRVAQRTDVNGYPAALGCD